MTRQEEGGRPSLGGKDGHEGSTSPRKSSKAELAEAKARGESPTSSLASSPTKIHTAPSPKKLPKMKMTKLEVQMEKRQEKDKKKQHRNKEETTAKEAAGNRKSDGEEVEDEEEKSSTEEESEEEVNNNNSDTTSPVGSAGGLFFLRRSRQKSKARQQQQQQQEKEREVRRDEKRQQLIKLKRLVEGDAAQPVELELPGSGERERNVEFVTKKAAALTKSKEDNGDEEDDDEGLPGSGEETATSKERRKNSLGSFGYGLWVPPSGRRRAMTDSELVITEHRPDGVADLPTMRRKGSLTKGPLVTTFTLPRKGSDNSKSPPSKKEKEKEKKEKEREEREREEKERKRKLKNLSRSAPVGPVLSSEEDDEEDEEDDEDSEEEEGEEFGEDDDDDDEDDEDDERACRYNQDTSPAFRNEGKSKEDTRSKDEEFVPCAAFLDLVLLEAKDLLVLNKRAMRKLFKHKLFAPFFTVSVGENTTRTKRTTLASPTFNHHLTFVYQEGGEEEPTLSVKLFYRCRTKAHRARRLHVGTMEVPLARLAAGKTHDLWLPIVPTCDYQLLWNWQKLGNDASNDARDVRVSAKSKDRSRTRLGSVHMTIHKSLDQSAGALSALGLPSLAVPLRLQVGDVILFHCSQFASHGAKLATRSRWDHVAMVAKHRKREGLYLFEATRDGVHLFHLDRRLAFYLESRTELGVRRLRTERTEEMEAALHDFVAEVDGRPYKTNPLELLRALRDSNECDNLDTIFCSQLVAAAYQRMGILSQELCSNNYLPADFATAKISDHLIGAELGEVVLVPPVRQKGSLGDEQPFGSGVGGSAPGSFQIGSFPF